MLASSPKAPACPGTPQHLGRFAEAHCGAQPSPVLGSCQRESTLLSATRGLHFLSRQPSASPCAITHLASWPTSSANRKPLPKGLKKERKKRGEDESGPIWPWHC